MTDAPVEIPTWSRQRWCLTIVLVLVIQAALIFVLERHASAPRHKAVAVPLIRLRQHIPLESLAVSDPTVFVLPHHQGFSGAVWLNHLPALNFQPADWTEPPRSLPFTAAVLGDNFKAFVVANLSPQLATLATVDPVRSVPTLYPLETLPAKSSLRVEGPLAARRMLAPPPLTAWASADLVTNSWVQLLVDASGRTISAVLLAPGLRLKQQDAADTSAVELAKAAQFAPAAEGALTVGTLVFEWQTLPPAATNAPTEIP